MKAIERNDAAPTNIIDIDSITTSNIIDVYFITTKQSVLSMLSMSNNDFVIKSETTSNTLWWNEYISRDDSIITPDASINSMKNTL